MPPPPSPRQNDAGSREHHLVLVLVLESKALYHRLKPANLTGFYWQYSNILEIVWAFSVFWSRPKHGLPPDLPRSGGNAFTTWVDLNCIRFVIVLDSCCISIGLVFIKDRPVSSFWVLRFRDLGASFSSFGCFVFEFWVLRFRDLGVFVFDLGCFVFEFWVLRASLFVFECFVFETT